MFQQSCLLIYLNTIIIHVSKSERQQQTYYIIHFSYGQVELCSCKDEFIPGPEKKVVILDT